MQTNKYKQGNLFIVCFDRYGTKVSKDIVNNYVNGRKAIDVYLSLNPDCSCVLERVIFNSKDRIDAA